MGLCASEHGAKHAWRPGGPRGRASLGRGTHASSPRSATGSDPQGVERAKRSRFLGGQAGRG